MSNVNTLCVPVCLSLLPSLSLRTAHTHSLTPPASLSLPPLARALSLSLSLSLFIWVSLSCDCPQALSDPTNHEVQDQVQTSGSRLLLIDDDPKV